MPTTSSPLSKTISESESESISNTIPKNTDDFRYEIEVKIDIGIKTESIIATDIETEINIATES